MTTYRTGNHWGVTIVAEPGPRPDTRPQPNGTEQPGEHWNARILREVAEHEREAQLVAVVVNGDQALAERICELLNAEGAEAHPHACPGCGKHYRMPKDAASCDRDHREHAARIQAKRGDA